MAVYFLYMKTFGRAKGSSAPSAAAYRAGERIRDERTGRTYDHSARDDVVHKEIVLPSKYADSDLSWAHGRANLWNAAEASETRRNSRIAREILVALPVELTPAQRVELVRGYSQELADRFGFAVDVAIHSPRTDSRNHHAHLLATTRAVTLEGFGEKTALELNEAQRKERGFGPLYDDVMAMRERWATVTNGALRAAGIDVQIDHRSLEAQGVEREPRPTLPRAAYEMERRGEWTFLGERMRREHEERVHARLERVSGRAVSAGLDAGRPEQTADTAAKQASSPLKASTLDDIQRQARENWLRLRAAVTGKLGREADLSADPTEQHSDKNNIVRTGEHDNDLGW